MLSISYLVVEIFLSLDMAGLEGIQDRIWQIQACSAKTGEGLQEGMEWLVQSCKKDWALKHNDTVSQWALWMAHVPW